MHLTNIYPCQETKFTSVHLIGALTDFRLQGLRQPSLINFQTPFPPLFSHDISIDHGVGPLWISAAPWIPIHLIPFPSSKSQKFSLLKAKHPQTSLHVGFFIPNSRGLYVIITEAGCDVQRRVA